MSEKCAVCGSDCCEGIQNPDKCSEHYNSINDDMKEINSDIKDIVEKWAEVELKKFGFGKNNPKIQYLIMLLTHESHGKDFVKRSIPKGRRLTMPVKVNFKTKQGEKISFDATKITTKPVKVKFGAGK